MALTIMFIAFPGHGAAVKRSTGADLGAILEETEQEKTRYTEQQAEQLLTSLIYRELQKGERKA